MFPTLYLLLAVYWDTTSARNKAVRTMKTSRMITITSSTKEGAHSTSEYWIGGKLPVPLHGLENFVINSGENINSITVDASDKTYTISIARFISPGDEYASARSNPGGLAEVEP